MKVRFIMPSETSTKKIRPQTKVKYSRETCSPHI